MSENEMGQDSPMPINIYLQIRRRIFEEWVNKLKISFYRCIKKIYSIFEVYRQSALR